MASLSDSFGKDGGGVPLSASDLQDTVSRLDLPALYKVDAVFGLRELDFERRAVQAEIGDGRRV